MKNVQIAVRKKGSKESASLSDEQQELKNTLERLRKKGLNPMQMCHKLSEHNVAVPGGGEWTYDRVVEECQRFKIPHHP